MGIFGNDLIVKQHFEKLKNNSTLHGFKQAVDSESHIIRQSIWVLILLATFGGFISTLVTSMLAYYKYESYTSTKIETTTELEMPSVTLCNINAIKLSNIKEKYPEIIPLIKTARLSLNPEEAKEVFNISIKEISEKYQNVTFYDVYVRNKFTVEEMFVECTLGSEHINCKDYLQPVLSPRGTCYTFHSRDFIKNNYTIKAYQAGNQYGINFVMNVFPEEYIMPATKGQGIQVIIHDPDVFPYADSHNIKAGTGQEVFIGIHKTVINTLPKPYSSFDCVPKEVLKTKGRIYDSYFPYSEELCLNDCFWNTTFDCGCQSRSSGSDACPLMQTYNCIGKNYHNYFLGKFKCNCEHKCENVRYSQQVSTNTYPNILEAEEAHLQNYKITNITEMRNKLTLVNVYFDSMTYTIVRQVPVISLNQLLSNFGGQMGLYLGASIVTIVEFIDFFCVSLLATKRSKTVSSTKVIKIKPSMTSY